MRDGWVETTLGDCLTRSIGGVWGGEPNSDEEDVLVVRSTEFSSSGVLYFETGVTRSIKKSQLASRELRHGDVLLEKSGGGPQQPVGRVVFVNEDIPNRSVCSNFIQLLTPDQTKAIPKYVFLLMWYWHTSNRTLQFQAQTTGIRNLRTPDYLAQDIELPPLAEQRRIVDVVESVDNYIAALQERVDAARIARNAVLGELLNAGGDGWVETTLGEVADVVGGGTPSTTVPKYWDGVIIWLTPTEVVAKDGKRIGDSIRKLTDVGLRNSGAQLLPANSVILTSRASVGFAAISECPLATNQGFQSLVPNSSSNAEFLMFWIQNNRAEFDSRAAGTTFKEISKTNVKSIKLLLPPLVEQRQIVEIVSSMDDSIQASEQTIVEAKNLRSGLLSDLLSGEHGIPESYDKLLGAA